MQVVARLGPILYYILFGLEFAIIYAILGGGGGLYRTGQVGVMVQARVLIVH